MNAPGHSGGHPGRPRRPRESAHGPRLPHHDHRGRDSAAEHYPDPGPDRRPESTSDGDRAADIRSAGVSAESGGPAAPPEAPSAPAAGESGGSAPTGPSAPAAAEAGGARHRASAYLRANPQVFVLLLICLVLGVGTFVAVLIALVTSGTVQTTGEPSGVIFLAHLAQP